jgi:Cu2+-exporting ATPase
LIAGTVNGDGSLRVQVAAVGEGTALAGIMRLVEEAQQSKSNAQVLADRAAGWLFYTALALASITAVAWIVASGFQGRVVERVVTNPGHCLPPRSGTGYSTGGGYWDHPGG